MKWTLRLKASSSICSRDLSVWIILSEIQVSGNMENAPGTAGRIGSVGIW